MASGAAQGAVFFDLDRTLLRGASGPVISGALREVGLMPERTLPGEGLIFGLFDLIGEIRPSMMLTRQAVRAAKGWSQATCQQAGRLAAERLAPAVQPWARVIIGDHQAAGRPVVLATTTPFDLVQPLAETLGFDGVLATRYRVAADGCYDGTFDGEFVWGKGKLAAVRSWAAANGVSVDESWAYSDSFYDLPLLWAVGRPVVVNPDPRLAAMAVVRRWPVQFLDAPPGVPKVLGVEPQTAMFPFLRNELMPWVRFRVEGTDHLPADGPALLGRHELVDGPRHAVHGGLAEPPPGLRQQRRPPHEGSHRVKPRIARAGGRIPAIEATISSTRRVWRTWWTRNTRMPARPTTTRSPARTPAIGTHRAARPSGSMAMPQSISWSSTSTHSPPSRTWVRKLVLQ